MYDLLTSHGDLDDLILFAEHVQDYERVILLYLEREDYEKALKTLEPLVNICFFNLNRFLYFIWIYLRLIIAFSTNTHLR